MDITIKLNCTCDVALLYCIKGELTQMKVFVLVLKNLLKEYRKQVFKCVCVMAAMSVIQLVIPLSMKKLVAAIEADPRLSVYGSHKD